MLESVRHNFQLSKWSHDARGEYSWGTLNTKQTPSHLVIAGSLCACQTDPDPWQDFMTVSIPHKISFPLTLWVGAQHLINVQLTLQSRTRDSLTAQVVKNLPAIWETWVQSLGQEEVTAIHPSILAQRIPRTEEPGGLQSMGSHRVRHDWATEQTRTHLPSGLHGEATVPGDHLDEKCLQLRVRKGSQKSLLHVCLEPG